MARAEPKRGLETMSPTDLASASAAIEAARAGAKVAPASLFDAPFDEPAPEPAKTREPTASELAGMEAHSPGGDLMTVPVEPEQDENDTPPSLTSDEFWDVMHSNEPPPGQASHVVRTTPVRGQSLVDAACSSCGFTDCDGTCGVEPDLPPATEELAVVEPAPFKAVDEGKDPLKRRAMRTDTKAWPGREQFEENRNGSSEEPIVAGADTKLADSLAPQLGLGFEVERVAGTKLPKLTDKFVVPPFTVLDTKQQYWQDRRRAWKTLGLHPETIYDQVADHSETQTGTSIFDPVLCEVAYRWFSAPGAVVLDPFAGGAVRGVMAGILGRQYTGIELRSEQVADNREQADWLEARCTTVNSADRIDLGRPFVKPTWIEGDATQLRNIDDAPAKADLIFTCPPYADLEVYSNDPRDLSTAPYATFRALLAQAVAAAAERLKNDRFAVVVLGEARHPKTGMPYDLITDMKLMARECGLPLYNELILLNSMGTAPVRSGGSMRTRKITRVHQHVFVFVKGDSKKAAEACGSAELDA